MINVFYYGACRKYRGTPIYRSSIYIHRAKSIFDKNTFLGLSSKWLKIRLFSLSKMVGKTVFSICIMIIDKNGGKRVIYPYFKPYIFYQK